MSAIKLVAATQSRQNLRNDAQVRAPQRLDVQPGYGTLTPREQSILARIHVLQGKGMSAQSIAGSISREYQNCTLEGVVKQYTTGLSSCEPLY